MRITFLRRDNTTKKLILIFSGWSTEPAFYSNLIRDGWDLGVVHDYRSMDFDCGILNEYDTVYVYAWSLGVFMASDALRDCEVAASFAINGTEYPADDRFGIPENIYSGTIEGLDKRNLRKFRRRMVASAEEFKSLLSREGLSSDIDTLKEELLFIAEESKRRTSASSFQWNRAYLPASDGIIPLESQRRFWDSRPEIPKATLDSSHLPDFGSILRSTIPDTERVGINFSKALTTYDTHAKAQYHIAQRLTEMISRHPIVTSGRILEIGHGSGLFSRLYAPVLQPEIAEYVDLYPTPALHLAPEEHYHTADGEEWLTHHPLPLRDYILSTSCIQWFLNPLSFLRSTSRSLSPRGILAFSTFLPGNLHELDSLRPTPLSYPSATRLTETLNQCYGAVETCIEEIPLHFATPREALMHLKHTGVQGGIRLDQSIKRFKEATYNPAADCYTLTYQVYYALCHSPKPL